MDIYKEKIKLFVSRDRNLKRNLQRVYGVLWGQCSTDLQAKIKGPSLFQEKSGLIDALWLAKELKKTTAGLDSKTDPRYLMVDAIGHLFKMNQGELEANDSYLDRFKSAVSTVEFSQGANVFCSINVMDKADDDPTAEEKSVEAQRFKAMSLLKNTDDKRFVELGSRRRESATLGWNEYFRNFPDIYELMVAECPDQPRRG